jgi:uncharacterized protein with HEPN domain
MTEKQKKYLSDMAYPIELIRRFESDIQTFDQYCADLKTKSAIERQIAIVGEALAKFLKEENAPAISNSK